jgi:hypothetical protein
LVDPCGPVREFPAILLIAYAAALTLGFQIRDGAYLAELCTVYPDEAPHYINGLLIAKYVSEGLGQPPLAFAKEFFLHFPKVSIGHWPPLFYVLEGGWMLVVSESKTSALVFSGVISAALAVLIGCITLRRNGTLAAFVAISFYTLTPLVRQNASAIMVDIFIGLLELLAALVFLQYLTMPNWRRSVAFGLIASAAILSKGNGLALALFPPLAILLTGQLALIFRSDFWLPVPIVALLCGPWYVATYSLASDGWVYQAGLSYAIAALAANASAYLTMFGVLGCLMAVYGFVCSFRARYERREILLARCLAALIGAIMIFQMTAPSGLDPRYIVGVIAPIIVLAAMGIGELSTDLAGFFGQRGSRRMVVLLATVLTLAVIAPRLESMLRVGQKPTIGMIEAAGAVTADPENLNRTVLVSSDGIGEGAFVVEMAQHSSQKPYIIARASKLLASANFLMEDYVARYQNSEELGKEVERLAIRFVVIDTSKNGSRFKHSRDLLGAARAHGWSQVGKVPHTGYDGETLIFDLKPRHVPSAHEQVAIGCVWMKPMSSGPSQGLLRLSKPFQACV